MSRAGVHHWLLACLWAVAEQDKMPAVSTGVKELYLSTSLGDLNKKAEIKPEKTSTRMLVMLKHTSTIVSKYQMYK